MRFKDNTLHITPCSRTHTWAAVAQDREKASHELQVDWIKLKEQLEISQSQLAKEQGDLVSQWKLAERVKGDFQR